MELKNDMDICSMTLFMHDGDIIDIYVCDAYCMLMNNTSTILSTNCCFYFGVIVYASILLLALYNILIVTVVIG